MRSLRSSEVSGFRSSQSVARLNGGWSNNPKMGPRSTQGGRGGGFAGRGDLEETRRYREGGGRDRNGYDLVFDVPREKRRREKSRSRSPVRYGDESREGRRERRSPSRGDGRDDRERRRSRSRERNDRGRYDRRR